MIASPASTWLWMLQYGVMLSFVRVRLLWRYLAIWLSDGDGYQWQLNLNDASLSES